MHRQHNLYLKESDTGTLPPVASSRSEVVLPLIFNTSEDSAAKPQFVRVRSNDTATFYLGNVAQTLGESAILDVKVNNTTIFSYAKSLQVTNVVIDTHVIDNIRPGNNTLVFTMESVVYTVVFKNMLITTISDLLNYLNDTVGAFDTYTITPSLPGGYSLKAAIATEFYNPNFIRLYVEDSAGPTTKVIVVDEALSTLFTAGASMWGALSQAQTGTILPGSLVLNPGFLPAYYWDFKSTLLTKNSVNRNWNSASTSNNIYRYYFLDSIAGSRYAMNWNKESITQFDLSIVDDQGVILFNGYTFSGPPFICMEVLGEQ